MITPVAYWNAVWKMANRQTGSQVAAWELFHHHVLSPVLGIRALILAHYFFGENLAVLLIFFCLSPLNLATANFIRRKDR
jgi:hypothetical protein